MLKSSHVFFSAVYTLGVQFFSMRLTYRKQSKNLFGGAGLIPVKRKKKLLCKQVRGGDFKQLTRFWG